MTIAEKILRAKADYDAVFESGKKAENEAFWNNFFQNGNRKDFRFAFAGTTWNTTNFKPNRSMQPNRVDYMFANADYLAIDLVEHLNDLGITIDFSKTTIFNSAFRYNRFTRLGIIDTTSSSALTEVFAYSRAVTIEKLIVKSDGSTTFNYTFQAQTYLENITFEGVIGNNIDFSTCTKLKKASITNIMEHLSTTSSGKTATFSKTAVDNAFETSVGAGDGSTSAEWVALKNAHTNWNIALST